jgi:hypothetical protein
MRRLFYLLTVLFVVAVSLDGYGQLNRKNIKKNNRKIGGYRGKKSHFGKDKIYNAFGFSLNALNYYGDLAPAPNRFSTDISFTKPAIAFSFVHRFGPRYMLLGSFMTGTLKGSDANSADPLDPNAHSRYIRNLSFRNRIQELTIVAQLDLFQNMATYISRVRWTPYVFAGVAVFHHNPQAKAPATFLDGSTNPDGGKWVDLQPLGTEGQGHDLQEGDANYGIKPYKLIQPAIPFGLGARFRVNPLVDISGEIGFRYLFTDYIDDVSRNYVDLGVFKGNKLAQAMSYRSGEVQNLERFGVTAVPELARDGVTYNLVPGYGKEMDHNIRGNKNNKDVYMVTTVRLTYILGKTFHRAKFR